MNKYLITGSEGLVGSSLKKLLGDGHVYHTRKDAELTDREKTLDYNDYVVMDKKFLRPEELHDLKGDPSKLKQHTDWTPEYTFETMLNEMIDYWMIKL